MFLPAGNCTKLIKPLIGSQSLIPTLQAPIHMAMKVVDKVGAAQSQKAQQYYQEEKMPPLPREVDKKVRLESETCSNLYDVITAAARCLQLCV